MKTTMMTAAATTTMMMVVVVMMIMIIQLFMYFDTDSITKWPNPKHKNRNKTVI
jgi:hypothetical protein